MEKATMIDQLIGHRLFVDGTRRPIYEDAQGQYVLDDEGEQVYGVYLLQEEDSCSASPTVFTAKTQRCDPLSL